jgi:pimeloyl-ACP methyl ester carboxylesterase
VLIGQSMGGLNALTYAAGGHASELAALVLVDVAPSVSQNGTQRIAGFVLAPPSSALSRSSWSGPRPSTRPATSARCAAVCSTTSANCPTAAGPGSTTAAISQETFEKIRASLPSLTERLPSIICGALVVRGAESDVLSNDDAECFAAALPNGRSESVANAGHTVQGDNPRALAEAFSSWPGWRRVQAPGT